MSAKLWHKAPPRHHRWIGQFHSPPFKNLPAFQNLTSHAKIGEMDKVNLHTGVEAQRRTRFKGRNFRVEIRNDSITSTHRKKNLHVKCPEVRNGNFACQYEEMEIMPCHMVPYAGEGVCHECVAFFTVKCAYLYGFMCERMMECI